MGRINRTCSGTVPPLFRLAGTAESLANTGLFRCSGQNFPNAHTGACADIFFVSSYLFISLRVQVKKIGGTPEQACVHAAFRCSGYSEHMPEQTFCRNNATEAN